MEKDEIISPSFNLLDKSFNREFSSNYNLSFIIGLSGFAYCIRDLMQNRLIAVEEIRFQKQPNWESLGKQLKSFILQSQVLNNKFNNVSVGIYNETSTLIPSAIYAESKQKEFLQFNFSRENIFPASDFLSNLDTYNIYDAPEIIVKTFVEIYGKVKTMHYSGSLLESLFVENKHKTGTKVYLHFFQKNKYGTASRYEIIILREGKLIFFNSFYFQEKEDIAYFLLYSMEQLNINPENSSVCFLGNIQKTDEAVELISNYVQSVEFGKRPGNFEYPYVFEELPQHFYYALLSQYMYA